MPKTNSLASRREKIPTPFFLEGSRQLKLFRASLPIQGLEQANQAFSEAGFVRVIKREYPGGQKWPAQIFDSGLFCARQAYSETVCAIPIFQRTGRMSITLC